MGPSPNFPARAKRYGTPASLCMGPRAEDGGRGGMRDHPTPSTAKTPRPPLPAPVARAPTVQDLDSNSWTRCLEAGRTGCPAVGRERSGDWTGCGLAMGERGERAGWWMIRPAIPSSDPIIRSEACAPVDPMRAAVHAPSIRAQDASDGAAQCAECRRWTRSATLLRRASVRTPGLAALSAARLRQRTVKSPCQERRERLAWTLRPGPRLRIVCGV
jgi:hypothetical protein